jgi:hypothetical protein
MLAAAFAAFVALIPLAQEVQCAVGQVLSVEHGRDYVLNVCSIGPVGLRGVEPPLRSADGLPMRQVGPVGQGAPVSGEVLGGKNIAPDAIAFLSKLVGQRVTLVNDGWRIGDREGRRYAYVFLADKSMLNIQMIQRGYGYADRQGSHPRRDEFIALENAARRNKLGVWEP